MPKGIAELKRSNVDIAVVVSAMGKTTDGLVAMSRQICPIPPRREMDMLLSTGERITMAMLCMALHEQGDRCGVADRFPGRHHHQ